MRRVARRRGGPPLVPAALRRPPLPFAAVAAGPRLCSAPAGPPGPAGPTGPAPGLGHTLPGGEAEAALGDRTLRVTQAELDVGASMPPLLQYNDGLVAVALELVELANGTSPDAAAPRLGEAEVDAVARVVAVLFSEGFVSAAEQYDAVRELRRVAGLRAIPAVQRAMHSLLAALVPPPVAAVVAHCDTALAAASPEQERLLERLVVLVLEGQEDDEHFVAALKDIELSFPALFASTAFVALLQSMNDVLLQARFAFLINEACLAFDPDGTGKVRLAELREALERVIPREAAARMMEGVEPNDDGTVYYPQMAQVFMRGVHTQ